MIRTIVIADNSNLTLTLPDSFLGKQIEIIAFVIEDTIYKSKKKASFSILEIPEELKNEYKFNRIEANER